MKKRFLILALALALPFAACAKTVTTESESVSPEETAVSEVNSEESTQPTEPKKVLFIGNSLTNCGRMPEHLFRVKNGQYTVTNTCEDGSTLEQHSRWFSGKTYTYRQAFEEADIIVLQEYGDYMGPMTDLAVSDLVQLHSEVGKKDAKIYYMMSMFDSSGQMNDLCLNMIAQQGILPLPIGDITTYICEKHFEPSQFVLEDGYHPSLMKGCFMAMAFVIIVDEEERTDADWIGSVGQLKRALPGETTAEKQQAMLDIQAEAYAYYQTVKAQYEQLDTTNKNVGTGYLLNLMLFAFPIPLPEEFDTDTQWLEEAEGNPYFASLLTREDAPDAIGAYLEACEGSEDMEKERAMLEAMLRGIAMTQ